MSERPRTGWARAWARQGFLTLSLDYRGSAARGQNIFTDAVREQLAGRRSRDCASWSRKSERLMRGAAERFAVHITAGDHTYTEEMFAQVGQWFRRFLKR